MCCSIGEWRGINIVFQPVVTAIMLCQLFLGYHYGISLPTYTSYSIEDYPAFFINASDQPSWIRVYSPADPNKKKFPYMPQPEDFLWRAQEAEQNTHSVIHINTTFPGCLFKSFSVITTACLPISYTCPHRANCRPFNFDARRDSYPPELNSTQSYHMDTIRREDVQGTFGCIEDTTPQILCHTHRGQGFIGTRGKDTIN